MLRTAFSAVIVASGLAAACGDAAPAPFPPDEPPAAVADVATAVPASAATDVEFVDATAAAGIGFVHTSGAAGRKYLPETLGSGALFLDVDSDGWQDIYFVNSTPWPGRSGGSAAPHSSSGG